MSEKIYDEQIAPELLKLANLCGDNGMNLVAYCEYEPGEGASTCMVKQQTVKTMLAAYAVRCNGNVDSMMIGLWKWAREKGVDTEQSMIAKLLNCQGDREKKWNVVLDRLLELEEERAELRSVLGTKR